MNLNQQIESATLRVEKRLKGADYTVWDVVREICSEKDLREVLEAARKYKRWPVAEIIVEWLRGKISNYFSITKDRQGIPLRECYRAGREWRWNRLDIFDLDRIKGALSTQRRQIAARQKLERLYELALDELETRGKSATFADIREVVIGAWMREMNAS